jgi:hypothetical protein
VAATSPAFADESVRDTRLQVVGRWHRFGQSWRYVGAVVGQIGTRRDDITCMQCRP